MLNEVIWGRGGNENELLKSEGDMSIKIECKVTCNSKKQ
jgi:hypothetical protein